MSNCKCIMCGNTKHFHSLLKLDNMPFSAQQMPTLEEIDNDKGIQLELVECMKCGLVQFNTSPVDYYKDVIRSSSQTMRDLRISQYKDFIDYFGLRGGEL